MSDNPHVQYANYQRMHKSKKSQGFRWDANYAERQMIRISNLHKLKTGKHINAHAEALVAHHEKAKEIKRQYVQHSTDLVHAKKAGDKERMERAAKGKAQAEKDHLAHTGEPVHESVEQQREIKQMKTLKEFKDACWKGYKAIGMKEKNGRKVPNCVPEEVEHLDESEHAVARLADKLETHYYNGHEMGSSQTDKESAIQKVKHHISKAPTKHLKALHKTNMGWENHRAGRQQGLTHPVTKHIASELKKRGVIHEEVEQIDEANPQGMSDREYARHELGKGKKPEVKVGAKVTVDGGGSGVVQKIYDKELSNGQKRKFIHLKDHKGRDFHHRYYAHRVRVMEEVEQIDELSKKKLKNYITKATDDKISAHSHDYRYHDFYDEEPDRDHDQDSKDYARAEKREKGIDLARAKVNKSGKSGRAIAKVKANEEVENLDELSKKTLGSYIKQAAGGMKGLGVSAHQVGSTDNPTHKEKMWKRALKREKGISMAADKLTKEDVEQVDEGDKKPYPKTWHDVDSKLGKLTDKMSPEEKVKKGFAHPSTLKKKAVKEEVELDEVRNTYQLYDDHKDFAKAHAEIDAAVKNAHNDPKAVKKAMRKHAKVGAEDSQSRDLIRASIKRRHGSEVAKKTKIGLFERVKEIRAPQNVHVHSKDFVGFNKRKLTSKIVAKGIKPKIKSSKVDKDVKFYDNGKAVLSAGMEYNEPSLEEGIISDIHRKVVSKMTHSDKWHEKMRARYGKHEWDTYWKKNRDKGLRGADKVLDTGFNEEAKLEEMSKLSDALAKIKHDFENPPADHKDAKPAPAKKPEPKKGGGMDYYPDSHGGRRYMGDSVEMDGETIKEASPKAGKNVVPPHVGALATGGIVKEEGKDPLVSSWNKSLVKRIQGSKHPEHVKTNLLAKAKKSKSASDAELVHQELDNMHEESEGENKPLGKVMRANDGKKKFKVYVKNAKGNTVKVGFGDPNMEIKRDDPERRKNFRARHNCDSATDRTTPKYWSCRQWRSSAKVEA